jgi:hypothetical protein
VLLVPCDADDAVAHGETKRFTIPEEVQKQMRQRVTVGRLRLPVGQP